MTREVVGARPHDTDAEPMVIVFDLGELTHGPETPPALEPITARVKRFRPPSWRAGAAGSSSLPWRSPPAGTWAWVAPSPARPRSPRPTRRHSPG